MCTVLLPPGVNPIEVNKYIIYQYIYRKVSFIERRRHGSYLTPKQTKKPLASDRTVTSLGPPVTTSAFSQDGPTVTVSEQHKTHICCIQLKQPHMGCIIDISITFPL
jgi:hypothetical protein